MPASAPRQYPMADRILVSEEKIQSLIAEIAVKIAAHYNALPSGSALSVSNPLVVVCVLKGSAIFTSDLVRHLSDVGVPTCLEFVRCSSYGSGTSTSGNVRMLLDLHESVEGRHVLVVEDIIDSAITLAYLLDVMKAKRPASLKTVALLDKVGRRAKPLDADFVGAVIPDEFVIGYGLDFNEKYRELRDIVVLKREYYANL